VVASVEVAAGPLALRDQNGRWLRVNCTSATRGHSRFIRSAVESTLVVEYSPLHRMTECCQVPEQTVPVKMISTGILLLTTVT